MSLLPILKRQKSASLSRSYSWSLGVNTALPCRSRCTWVSRRRWCGAGWCRRCRPSWVGSARTRCPLSWRPAARGEPRSWWCPAPAGTLSPRPPEEINNKYQDLLLFVSPATFLLLKYMPIFNLDPLKVKFIDVKSHMYISRAKCTFTGFVYLGFSPCILYGDSEISISVTNTT